MAAPTSTRAVTAALEDAIDQARLQAREQLSAAWQLHATRIEDLIRIGWRSDLDRLLDERFRDLAQSISAGFDAALEERVASAVDVARGDERRVTIRQVCEHLNQSTRRLFLSESHDDWVTAMLDAASGFCDRAAVFTLQGKHLKLEKSTSAASLWQGLLADSPAIAEAVEKCEPIVCAFSSREISESLAAAFSGAVAPRVYLFPVVVSGKAVAVLYAEANPENVDANALELAANTGAAVWFVRSTLTKPEESGLIPLMAATPAPQPPPAAPPPRTPSNAWAALPADEQDLHIRAQRFARVQVAEIRLYKSSMVKRGRSEQNLYVHLASDIDRARDSFLRDFIQPCPSMTDYLHMELVRTLANEDATLLGSSYPGPLA